ncbi:MAG TPA: hypothetical protein DGH68_10190 [Bacteroidetes bacterium]|nr:hypothetical protein [Bacteroidota bacterium]
MTATHTHLRLLVTVFGAVIILFHLLALLFPSGINWGFHHLAFLSPAVSIPIIILMLAALVPQVQAWAIGMLDRPTKKHKKGLWIASFCILGLLLWMLRQQTFFLGDGYLVMRNISRAHSVTDLPAPFPTAPLSALIAYHLKEILSSMHVEPAAQFAWQIQSIVCGIASVPVAYKLAGALASDHSSKWVVAAFLIAGGAAQLFFGYVETYPPAYVATMLFLWLSLEYMAGRVSLYLPFISFGLLFTFHFGMLSLIPAVLFLFIVQYRRHGFVSVLLPTIAAKGVTYSILWLCGYTPARLVSVVLKGGSYFLPFTEHDNWQTAYSLFSFWHLIDLFNACILLSPFLFLMIPLALIAVSRQELRWKPETIFLALTFVGALGWMFMTNFEVGMSRDWDVIAPLSVCAVAFALYGLQRGWGAKGEMRHRMLGMAAVTLLHMAAWVIVNADEGRSIARYAMLQDDRVRSQRAIAYACEDLAGFYRDRNEYAAAIPFMEKTVAIDSTNARRWLSLANEYQLGSQDENAMRAYEESARLGIRDKAAFFNLGILYYNRHRLDDAIAMLQRAATIDSADTLISSNLKLMIARKAGGEGPKQ